MELQCNYFADELTWNIEDVRGCNVFKHDKTFSQPYELQKSQHLLPTGSYTLKLRCSYGDGGVLGKVSKDDKQLVNISWRDLNWHYSNGYLHYAKFEI